MKPRHDTSLGDMPKDVIQTIMKDLAIGPSIQLSRVSKRFRDAVVRNNLDWQQKLENHFPDRSSELKNQPNINFYAEFDHATRTTSSSVSTKRKKRAKLFTAVISGHLAILQTAKLTLVDLATCLDEHGFTLMDYAKKYNQQEILDYFFAIVVAYFSRKDHSINYEKKDKLDYVFIQWLIFCHRSKAEFMQHMDSLSEKQRSKMLALRHETISTIRRTFESVTDIDTGYELLHFAAMAGATDIVIALLDNYHISIQRATELGFSALWLTVIYGHSKTAQVLLDRNATADAYCSLVSKDYNPHICDNEYLLHAAIKLGRVEMIEMLITHGASITKENGRRVGLGARNSIKIAIDGNQLQILQLLLTKCPENIKQKGVAITLSYAAKCNRLDILKLLHKNKIWFDKLHAAYCAMKYNRLALLKYLIKLKMKPNANYKDGNTLLTCAAKLGNIDAAKYLLKVGADRNETTQNGATALLIAVEYCQVEMLNFLLGQGVNPNTPLRESGGVHVLYNVFAGDTPLHAAIKAKNSATKMVRLLLAHPETQLDIEDKDGLTPLELAKKLKKPKIVKLLEQRQKQQQLTSNPSTMFHQQNSAVVAASASANESDKKGAYVRKTGK